MKRTTPASANQTSVYYAAVRSELKASGSPILANDVWLAVLARQHRIPIVTHLFGQDEYRAACLVTKAVEHRRTLKRLAQNQPDPP